MDKCCEHSEHMLVHRLIVHMLEVAGCWCMAILEAHRVSSFPWSLDEDSTSVAQLQLGCANKRRMSRTYRCV